MQGMPNRLGLGLRPPLPSYGQGPSMSALAAQQQMHHGNQFVPPQPRATTLFIGSISGGITDAFLNQLLSVRPLWLKGSQIELLSICFAGVWANLIFQTSHNAGE